MSPLKFVEALADLKIKIKNVAADVDRYGGMSLSALEKMSNLEEENRRLRQAVQRDGTQMRQPYRVRFVDGLGRTQHSEPHFDFVAAVTIALGESISRPHVDVIGADGAVLMDMRSFKNPIVPLNARIRELEDQVLALKMRGAA